MKLKKTINWLVVIIIVLSSIACLIGIFSKGGTGAYEIQSFRGETITLYGKGIYRNDSVAVVSQGIAQDVVTILFAVPLLIVSWILWLKGSFRGLLLITGTLGYFLYTYISYVFLWMYNPLFLVYVIIMSSSFFTFILCMLSFDIETIKSNFRETLPVKFLGGFQIFFAIFICLLWLGRIIPSLTSGATPVGLEHYTTLVIQGLDLGFIVPTALISGILLIKKKPFGYLLSSIIIIKGISLATAISAMIIGQVLAGVSMSIIEILIFPLFNLVFIYCLFSILKNVIKSK